MAGVNIANVGLLFTRYLDGVVETLNHTSKARTRVKKQDKWSGSHIEGRLHLQRTGAIGNTEDGGAFPTPDKQDYTPYKAYRKFSVGSIQLTDGVMATASKSKNVAKDVITSEVKGLLREMMKYENGMFFRNGDGSVATFSNALSASASDRTVDDSRMLWEGVTYDIYDTTLATKHGTATVSSVESAPDGDNARVNFGATLSGASAGTEKAVWKGSVNRAITGLGKLIDNSLSGTFQGVTMSTAGREHYTSLVMGNSGTNRDLTPSLFRQMLAGLKQKSGDDRPANGLTVLTNAWQAIEVEELYEGEMRLSPSDKVGGFEVTAFQSALGRIGIEVDVDATYNRMYFCDFDKIYRAVQKKLGWRRQGGSIFLRSDTAGVWTATALEICEFYIKERHTSGRLDDLNETRSTMF